MFGRPHITAFTGIGILRNFSKGVRVRGFRLPLLVVCLLLAGGISACDMPPNDDLSDSEETETLETDSVDTETETDSEQETESEAYTTCMEAMICSSINPDEVAACLEGMDEDNQDAAMALTVCTAGTCSEYVDNVLSFGFCLVQNCPDEAMECLGESFIGVYY